MPVASGNSGAQAGRHDAPARRDLGVWGAGIGLLLAWLGGGVDPVISVLSASALVAFAAHAWGDRDPTATLTMRLLLAGVYVTIGVRHPTPLGVALGILGAASASSRA